MYICKNSCLVALQGWLPGSFKPRKKENKAGLAEVSPASSNTPVAGSASPLQQPRRYNFTDVLLFASVKMPAKKEMLLWSDKHVQARHDALVGHSERCEKRRGSRKGRAEQLRFRHLLFLRLLALVLRMARQAPREHEKRTSFADKPFAGPRNQKQDSVFPSEVLEEELPGGNQCSERHNHGCPPRQHGKKRHLESLFFATACCNFFAPSSDQDSFLSEALAIGRHLGLRLAARHSDNQQKRRMQPSIGLLWMNQPAPRLGRGGGRSQQPRRPRPVPCPDPGVQIPVGRKGHGSSGRPLRKRKKMTASKRKRHAKATRTRRLCFFFACRNGYSFWKQETNIVAGSLQPGSKSWGFPVRKPRRSRSLAAKRPTASSVFWPFFFLYAEQRSFETIGPRMQARPWLPEVACLQTWPCASLDAEAVLRCRSSQEARTLLRPGLCPGMVLWLLWGHYDE